MVPHVWVVNLLLGAQNRYAPEVGSVFGVPTPYVFDVSVYNIFSSLIVFRGSCRLLHDGSALAMPPAAADSYTHLAAVPSILAVSRVSPSVRHLQVGGEALTRSAVEAVPSGADLYNYYGPTEAAIWATRRVVPEAERKMAVGHGKDWASAKRWAAAFVHRPPLVNVTCYTVDPDSAPARPRLQPVGVYGELWLGGIQVARGYLRRPKLTADRFVANPWAHAGGLSPDSLAYCTGDRVRWFSDGELQFGGRLDSQVKLRGQRLELGEIDAISQPGVLEAVALLRTEGPEPMIVAYVHPKSVVTDAKLDTEASEAGVRCLWARSLSSPAFATCFRLTCCRRSWWAWTTGRERAAIRSTAQPPGASGAPPAACHECSRASVHRSKPWGGRRAARRR